MLHNDHSKNKEATKRVLHIMQHFSSSLDNYIHLLLPPIVATIDNVDNEREVSWGGPGAESWVVAPGVALGQSPGKGL